MENIKDTIMSQYANSPKLLSIISGLNDAIDNTDFQKDFFNYVYRLSAAKGFGLDIWARKVGVSRFAPIANPNAKVWGFDPADQPFNTYPFSDGGAYSSYKLLDEQLKALIMIKAAKNLLCATALNINKFLLTVFDGRKSY